MIIDDEKKELPEIMETYSDTWGKMVKLLLLKKFSQNGEIIYSMHPDFENIEFVPEGETMDTPGEYTEEYHLEGVSETVKNIYTDIKDYLLKVNPSLIFNPTKHYISIRKEKNFAFFWLSRKKINLVIMNPEDDARKVVTKHSIKTLTSSVQKFYGGPSCGITMDSENNLDEIKDLLKKHSHVSNN